MRGKNQKKFTALLLRCTFALALCGVPISPVFAAADGNVTVSGIVLEDGTCVIHVDDRGQTITLSDVPTSELRVAGDTAKPKTFSVRLSKCRTQDFSKVKLLLKAFSQIPGILQADQSSTARNVNFYITKLDGTPVELLNQKDDRKASGTGVGTTQPRFDYIVQYYATGRATPGTVSATLNFEVTYN